MSLSPIGMIGPAILAGQVAGSAAVSLGRGFGQLLQAAAKTSNEAESTPAGSANATELLPANRSLSQNFLRGDLRNFASQLQDRLTSLFGSSEDFQLRIDSSGQTELNAADSLQSVWQQAFGNDSSLKKLVVGLSDRLSQVGPDASLTVTPSTVDIRRH